MATMVPPQKNVEYIFYIGLVSQADTKLLQNNPTLAAGDVLVSTDGGATSNLDTLPAVTPASSDMVKVTVSTTEMNGDNIIIVFSDAAGSEWCDLLINIQTAAQSLDTMDTNIDDIETDTNELQGLIASSKIAAQVKGIDNIDFPATQKTSLETAVDDGLDNAIGGSPTADSVAQRIKALDLLTEASGGGDLATILTAIQDGTYGLSAIETLVDELESRLTATRAGYLDELGSTNIPADIDTLLTRLSATRAGYLDNLSAGAAALEATLTAIKGTTWSNETLKAIKDVVDAITGDATAANQTTIINHLTGIKGTGWSTETLKAIKELIDNLEDTLTLIKGEDWDEEVHTLQMIHDISDDSFAQLESILEGIKGIGWTDETLKAIKELVDELESGDKPVGKANFEL